MPKSKKTSRARLTWYQKAKIYTDLLNTLLKTGRQFDINTGRIIFAKPAFTQIIAVNAAHAAKKAKRTGWCQ